jgi:hypothetical protein
MGARVIYKKGDRIAGTRLCYLRDVSHYKQWRRALFACDCGALIVKPIFWVVSGNTTSCGCRRREMVALKNTTHGKAPRGNPSPAYRSWQAMCQRVKVSKNYKNVRICKQWVGVIGFRNFLHSLGERPNGMTLDRKNNNGHYNPENCRWATKRTQANNTRKTVFVIFKGKKYPQTELIRMHNIHYSLVKERMRRGISRIDAITTPPYGKKKH